METLSEFRMTHELCHHFGFIKNYETVSDAGPAVGGYRQPDPASAVPFNTCRTRFLCDLWGE